MFLKIGIYLNFFVLKFVGLIPYGINLKKLSITHSIKSIIWSIFFGVVLLIFDSYLEKIAYTGKDAFFGNNVAISDILRVTGFLSIFICIYWILFNIKATFKIVKKFKIVFNHLNKLIVNLNFHTELQSFFIKFGVTQLTLTLIDYIFYCRHGDASFFFILIYSPLIGIKFLFQSAVLIKYDFCLCLIKIGFKQINKIIKNQLIGIKPPKNVYKKAQLQCEMRDKIDELKIIYFHLFEISELVTKVFSIPVITVLIFIFNVWEIELLTLYNSNPHELIFRLVLAIAWSFIRMLELIMVLSDGSDIIEKVNLIWFWFSVCHSLK